jgi:hypothetical protein
VAIMPVCLGSYSWRDNHYLQMDALGTYRFGGYPCQRKVPLLAYDFGTWANNPASRLTAISAFHLHILYFAIKRHDFAGGRFFARVAAIAVRTCSMKNGSFGMIQSGSPANDSIFFRRNDERKIKGSNIADSDNRDSHK